MLCSQATGCQKRDSLQDEDRISQFKVLLFLVKENIFIPFMCWSRQLNC